MGIRTRLLLTALIVSIIGYVSIFFNAYSTIELGNLTVTQLDPSNGAYLNMQVASRFYQNMQGIIDLVGICFFLGIWYSPVKNLFNSINTN